MSVIYNAAVKTARMTATRDYFANGTLELLSAADVVLAIFGLSATGGTVSGDMWTIVLDATTVTGAATGTCTKAQMKTSGGSAHLTGLTVGTGGTDIVLNTTTITSGLSVTLTSTTLQHAPDPIP